MQPVLLQVLLIVLGTQLPGCFGGCYRKGVQCFEYEVIDRTAAYEERQYPASQWVSTTVEGPSLADAMRVMYRKLFYYIQGANVEGLYINTTTPVRTKVEPCGGATCPSLFTMSFLIPPGMGDAPAPTDPAIFLKREPPKRYLARGFGGRPAEQDWLEEGEKMLGFIKKDYAIEKGHYFTLWYDPPLQLFNRLNEIWMEVKQVSPLEKNVLI